MIKKPRSIINARLKFVAFATCLVMLLSTASHGTPKLQGIVKPETNPSSLAIFDEVTKLIADNYIKLSGQTALWHRLTTDARPHIKANLEEVYLKATLQDLVKRIGLPEETVMNDSDQRYWLVKSLEENNVSSPRQIGAWFKRKGRHWFIDEVYPDSSAQKAGLKRGDQILLANNGEFDPIKSLSGDKKTLELSVRRLPAGKPTIVGVEPFVKDPGLLLIEAMEKSNIIIEKSGKKIGYLHLWLLRNESDFARFGALLETQQKEAEVFILDLRNSFSLLEFPVHDLFIKDGKVGPIYKKRLIVIANASSSGAIEKPLAVLKKNQRAIIIGSKSQGRFSPLKSYPAARGKWLVQLPINPQATFLEHQEGLGIDPDIVVEETLVYANGMDEILEEALNLAAKL